MSDFVFIYKESPIQGLQIEDYRIFDLFRCNIIDPCADHYVDDMDWSVLIKLVSIAYLDHYQYLLSNENLFHSLTQKEHSLLEKNAHSITKNISFITSLKPHNIKRVFHHNNKFVESVYNLTLEEKFRKYGGIPIAIYQVINEDKKSDKKVNYIVFSSMCLTLRKTGIPHCTRTIRLDNSPL